MTSFRRNPRLQQELDADPAIEALRAKAARAAAAEVRAAAPNVTGYYRRRVRARGAFVIAGDPFSHLVEFGSIHNPPYAPMRRGVRAAGLRLDESPRG